MSAPKLLVIDDELDILVMIRDYFSVRGYQVLTAPDGLSGLELLELERPEVVLLDLKMKQMDGDRFILEAKRKNIPSKILVITGYQDEVLRERVEKMGIDAFLEKPVSILELQAKIQALLIAEKRISQTGQKADNLLR